MSEEERNWDDRDVANLMNDSVRWLGISVVGFGFASLHYGIDLGFAFEVVGWGGVAASLLSYLTGMYYNHKK